MQFRASKWAAISLGLLPYSNVGYSMGEYREDTEFPDKSTTVSYSGEGGLHQLYLGAGFKIIKIFLSVRIFVSLGRYNKNRCGDLSVQFKCISYYNTV